MFWQKDVLTLESALDRGLFVLARDRHKRAFFRKSPQQLLVQAVTLTMMIQIPMNALRPDLADDPPPQRVVQVCNQPLLRRGVPDQTGQKPRDGRRMFKIVGKVRF